MIYLEQLQLHTAPDSNRTDAGFPLSLPALRNLDVLRFETPVSFFIGANGSGKSTLLEGIAASTRLPSLTQSSQSPLMATGVELARSLRLVRRHHPKRGFFFRADDVTGFLQGIQKSAAEYDDLAAEFSHIEGDWGRARAMDVARGQQAALHNRYGEDPFAKSHGELFLDLFKARITAPGLYLMDEPEAPLSPGSQIALLALIMDKVKEDSQFIIATHSPILMACPDAVLFDFDVTPLCPVNWEDAENVQLMRAFLNHPESFIRHLK
ncbi:MAG: AAA family ATPase [Gammaproteobacteria bacterium]|nr:AAA family ATPase [Gammaproteobacteria bacterium]